MSIPCYLMKFIFKIYCIIIFILNRNHVFNTLHIWNVESNNINLVSVANQYVFILWNKGQLSRHIAWPKESQVRCRYSRDEEGEDWVWASSVLTQGSHGITPVEPARTRASRRNIQKYETTIVSHTILYRRRYRKNENLDSSNIKVRPAGRPINSYLLLIGYNYASRAINDYLKFKLYVFYY